MTEAECLVDAAATASRAARGGRQTRSAHATSSRCAPGLKAHQYQQVGEWIAKFVV
jgi:hypothetical protein